MQPKKLIWKRENGPNAIWVGTLPEGRWHIRFALLPLSEGHYKVKSGVNGIKDSDCYGLVTAKRKAQWLFDAYVLDLLDP